MERMSALGSATARSLTPMYERLRARAYRHLLDHRQVRQVDALDSALQDGFQTFLRKQATATEPIRWPEAYAFRIIQLTFWDYRRRAQRPEQACAPTELPERQLTVRHRYADGESLFGSLAEPHLYHWYRRLPLRDQQLIDWRCQGYQDDEIAARLGMAHGSVRNRFSRLLREARVVARA